METFQALEYLHEVVQDSLKNTVKDAEGLAPDDQPERTVSPEVTTQKNQLFSDTPPDKKTTVRKKARSAKPINRYGWFGLEKWVKLKRKYAFLSHQQWLSFGFSVLLLLVLFGQLGKNKAEAAPKMLLTANFREVTVLPDSLPLLRLDIQVHNAQIKPLVMPALKLSFLDKRGVVRYQQVLPSDHYSNTNILNGGTMVQETLWLQSTGNYVDIALANTQASLVY